MDRPARFTESQNVGILKEGDAGVPLADLVRKHGVSRATDFKWKSKYAGATVADLRQMKDRAENATLKRMYADLALENSAIKATGGITSACTAVNSSRCTAAPIACGSTTALS
jgi:putative transposase